MALYIVQFLRSLSHISKYFPWRLRYPITASLLYNYYRLIFGLRDGASHPNLDLSNMLSDHNHRRI